MSTESSIPSSAADPAPTPVQLPRIFPRVLQSPSPHILTQDLLKNYRNLAKATNEIPKNVSTPPDLPADLVDAIDKAVDSVVRYVKEAKVTREMWDGFDRQAKASGMLVGDVRQAAWEVVRALRVAGLLLREVQIGREEGEIETAEFVEVWKCLGLDGQEEVWLLWMDEGEREEERKAKAWGFVPTLT